MEYKTQLSPWHRSLLDQPWWQPHCPGRSGAGERSAAGRPRGRPVPGITAPAPASPTEEKGKTNRKGVRRMSGHRFKLLGPKVIAIKMPRLIGRKTIGKLVSIFSYTGTKW